MKQTKFRVGLLVGVIVGTAASIACSDAATDIMGNAMRDAGGMLVDAGLGLMDAGSDVRDASEAMLDAARADSSVTVREITCDQTATRTDVYTGNTYTVETFYAIVPMPSRPRLSTKRLETISCDLEYFDRSTPGTCSAVSCSDTSPDLAAFCTAGTPTIADNRLYVSCGSRQTFTFPEGSTSTPYSYGQRYRHVYLLTED